MWTKIKTFLKQYFCTHLGTMTETQVEYFESSSLTTVRTECTICGKSLPAKFDILSQQYETQRFHDHFKQKGE